jgi:hypothetical protein
VLDTTVERKTADHLFDQTIAVIRELESKMGVVVVAFTTDASGESRAARKRMNETNEWRHIVTPNCYAHQVRKYCYGFSPAHDNYRSIS